MANDEALAGLQDAKMQHFLLRGGSEQDVIQLVFATKQKRKKAEREARRAALIEAKEGPKESPTRGSSIPEEPEEKPEFEVTKKGGLSFITRAILPEKPKQQAADQGVIAPPEPTILPEVTTSISTAPIKMKRNSEANKPKSMVAKRFASRKNSY